MRSVAWPGILCLSVAGCAGAGEPLASRSEQAIETSLLEIHQINVGWGSSVFIVGPDGTTVLLEAGDTGDGASRVVPYLQSLGFLPAGGLDYTIVGHQHCDHLGGLDEVVDAGYDVRVANFYNGSTNTTSCVTEWNDAAASTTAGAPIAPSPGEQIPLGGGARLTFVAVNGQIVGGGSVPVSNENDRSIAVLVQHGGFDYLWASDLGGGNIDTECTGRFTSSQVDVESFVVQAISPGGAAPMISAGGIDVLNVNHHGSESSTNMNWMNLSAPAVALIGTGAGQGTSFEFPRIDVVEHVLLAQAACITAPAALVLQSEEGSPTGPQTSFAGFSVGNIRVVTDGATELTVSADGAVSQGPSEVTAAGLPRSFALDDAPAPPDTEPPVTSITSPAPGAIVQGIVAVTASASDDVGVARVELWIDGALHAPDFAAPYEWSWDTLAVPNGGHTLETRAFDAAGNPGASAPVAVTVDNPPVAIVMLNEILANEPGSDTSGEFVELYNAGNAAADLGGWQLLDGVGVRHTFAAGTQLAPGRARVVFASEASTGALGLNNAGDTVRLLDAEGAEVDAVTYGSGLGGTDGVSMNRNPDATAGAPFVLHTAISTLPSSPGLSASGEPFGECAVDADCDDGDDACTGAETCVDESCVAGTPPTCDDGSACTDDSCEPATGCVFVDNGSCTSDVVASDGFEGGFSGGSGWSAPSWSVSGDATVITGDGPHSGARHARLRRGTGLIQRAVSLTGRTGARLGVWARVESLEGSDRADVRASADGGPFVTLLTLGPAQSGDGYVFWDLDLSVCDGAASCLIQLDAGMNATNDRVFVDDLEVTAL